MYELIISEKIFLWDHLLKNIQLTHHSYYYYGRTFICFHCSLLSILKSSFLINLMFFYVWSTTLLHLNLKIHQPIVKGGEWRIFEGLFLFLQFKKKIKEFCKTKYFIQIRHICISFAKKYVIVTTMPPFYIVTSCIYLSFAQINCHSDKHCFSRLRKKFWFKTMN